MNRRHALRLLSTGAAGGGANLFSAQAFAQEKPGFGMEVDEKLAAKFPYPDGPPNFDYNWGTTRRRDGAVIRP